MLRGFWKGVALGTLAVVALALWSSGDGRSDAGRGRPLRRW